MKKRNSMIALIGFVFVLFIPLLGKSERVKADNTEDAKEIVVKDGMTQEAFSYEEAIVDKVYVETPVDSDEDGEKDRIYVEIMRPKETENGMQVPVIFNMSPYNGGLYYPDYHDVDKELYGGKPASSRNLKDHYFNYFVPRGYAVVTANSIGTEHSDGCPTTGDKKEILAAKTVIDWFNHRAVAYDKDGKEVAADWSTGNVGMIGLSYDGTLANGVATTGVEGLKTIVPINAITNWYDYYRANGAVIAPGGYQGDDADRLARGVLTRDNPDVCKDFMDQIEKDQDRKTGDYNGFWDARNYLKDADQIKASVFLIHGLNDVNVQKKQFAQWWELLKKNEVPRKLWLHQGEHVDPLEVRGEAWLTTLNKWFAYWLYDIENDVMDEAMVEIEHVDQSWEELNEWPRKDAEDKTLYLTNDDRDESIGLSINDVPSDQEKERFIDNASIKASEIIQHPFTDSNNRLAYVSPTLEESVRLSGTPELTIKASVERSAANLSALLVDYGPDGEEIVTRGWMDPRNRNSLSKSEALIADQPYRFNWEMEPHDYEFKKGHRIGIVLLSSDHAYTKRPEPGTEITVYPEESHINLPLVGNFPGEDIQTASAEDKDHPDNKASGDSVSQVFIYASIILVVIAGFGLIIALRKASKSN